MRKAVFFRTLFVVLGLSVVITKTDVVPSLITKITVAMSNLPRYEKLPLFDPHRKTFTCTYQAQHVPPIDPQAELWFQQALALDDPDIDYRKRDYPKIYQLYVQAADRGHWKAMLNLASLIISSRTYTNVPQHDPEIAIQWVEKAMALGVPDAYDMMGTYHQNGMVKGAGATTAYAFFQRAADMGSPSAMEFLGKQLDGTYDNPGEGFWGNISVATPMLECALAQGYGDAAEELAFIYADPRTTEAKLRALAVLHEGVKLGSETCASKLFVEFNGFNLTNGRNLPGSIDKGRAERYLAISESLQHYQGRLKLPNLDKVLPLPPAPLPKWDGNVQTLIDAAKAVTPTPKVQQGAALQDREFIPYGYAVPSLDQSTMAVAGNRLVPHDGYWIALCGPASLTKSQLIPARGNTPEHYRAGERFQAPSFDWITVDQVQWHYLGEAYALPPQRDDFLKQMIGAGFLREVPEPASKVRCNGQQRCPQTGIWEGRVADDHPMAVLYNRWDRQAFVEQDHAFPHPQAQFIDIAAHELQWTYLGSPNAETGIPGIREIGL